MVYIREAFSGIYIGVGASEIDEISDEIFNNSEFDTSSDKANLKRDAKRITSDYGRAYKKHMLYLGKNKLELNP